MIKVAYMNVDNLNLEKSYELLPQNRKTKVDRYRFEKDKKLSAGAYLLLDCLLKEENITHPIFKVEKYGKAYIDNYENIHFNLSHSGNIAACAISDKKIGIDVEYTDPAIDLDIAKNYFFNTEYKSIITSCDPSNEFFKYWVLKESYMKYTGLGFNLDLNKFEIIIDSEIKLKNDKNNLKFNLFNIDEYKLAVCSNYNLKKIKKYEINELSSII